MDIQQVDELRAVLKANVLSVVSTVADNTIPEAALVAFAEDSECNLYFQTRVGSRKYHNISQNPHVAFVIGWEPSRPGSLQFEGISEEVALTPEIRDLFIGKASPSTPMYIDHADARFFKVKPTWIRYSNYAAKPVNVWDHSF